MSKGTNIVKNILVVSIVLAVIAAITGIVLVVSSLTNGFTTDFKSFILKYEDEYITNDTDLEVFVGEKNSFIATYVFEGDVGTTDFTADIVVNEDNDFDFIHGLEYDNFSDIDISSFYTITMDSGGFTLVMHTFDLLDKLRELYPDEEIEIPEGTIIDPVEISYFNLVVSSYNEKTVYCINLFQLLNVESITIDPGSTVILGG